MKLQFGNLIVRSAQLSDTQQLAEWWNDGAVMAHAGFPNGLGTTPEKIASQLRENLLVIQEDNRLIGECNYKKINENIAEIGIKICETDCQNRGVGRKVLSLLIKWLFQNGCVKIVLDTNLSNRRAQHVYESLGFRKLRVNFNSWKDQLGNFQSSVDYELLEKDFINYLNDIIQIDANLRLRRFDGIYDFAFEWYQDCETVLLVDGVRKPYSYETLTNMYNFLNKNGELYFIEVNQNDFWKPIGDVMFSQKDLPIVIGEPAYRGKGIGKKVISALIQRGRDLGFENLFVGEIYDFNEASRKCFESLGFRAYQKTEKGSSYKLSLK